jgi:hypothetical protein
VAAVGGQMTEVAALMEAAAAALMEAAATKS